MNLRLAIRGDLGRVMDAEVKAGAGAVTTAIRRRTNLLQRSIRRQIQSVGLGSRLPKAIRANVYPQGRKTSLEARGIVRSTALYKRRPGGLVDLITVFDEGATARGSEFLILQIGAGVQLGGAQRAKAPTIDPKTMAILPLRSGKGYLVVRKRPGRGRDTQGNWGDPLYLLLKQVTIRNRLSLDPLIERATSGIEQLIVNEWERRTARAGISSE